MTPEQPAIASKPVAYWREQIDLAKGVRNTYERWWDENLKAYSPQPGMDPLKYGTEINTNRIYTMAERKGADLFYQKPDVTLKPTPLMELDPQLPLALQAHQEIVNEYLGEDHVNVVEMMDAVKFDLMVTAGLGFTVMGYEQVTVDVPHPDDPDGMMGLPPVPVPITQRCFWEEFSPKQALIPHNFRSTRFDRAPWLGYAFELPLTKANRVKFNLPDDYAGKKADGTQHFDHGVDQTQATEDVFTGVRIFYRSCFFREDRPHPDHLTELVLVDGLETPALEQDCQYQTLDAQGQLTPDSLVGNPIHIFSLRSMTDSAYPPSDATMILPLQSELNTFRTQMVQFRDASTLKWMYNIDTLPKDAVDKMVRAPIGGMVGVPSEAYIGEGAIRELPHGSMPRESFVSNDYIDNDIARTTAIDASGAGVQSQSSSTATEQQIIAANANARLDKERGRLLGQYIKGVTKFSTLLQRYLPVEEAALMVGPQRVGIWDQWRKMFPSALSFTAMPDSALRVDQAVDRKTAQDLYSFLANDPFINRQALLTKLLRKFHLDPMQIVKQPDPPKPEPPKLALSFKGEDLVAPQAPIVMEILLQLGVQVSPQAIMQSQQLLLNAQMMAAAEAEAENSQKGQNGQKGDSRHGGKVAQQESLSKHASDQTGGMQNTGAPAALGAGGGMI